MCGGALTATGRSTRIRGFAKDGAFILCRVCEGANATRNRSGREWDLSSDDGESLDGGGAGPAGGVFGYGGGFHFGGGGGGAILTDSERSEDEDEDEDDSEQEGFIVEDAEEDGSLSDRKSVV